MIQSLRIYFSGFDTSTQTSLYIILKSYYEIWLEYVTLTEVNETLLTERRTSFNMIFRLCKCSVFVLCVLQQLRCHNSTCLFYMNLYKSTC